MVAQWSIPDMWSGAPPPEHVRGSQDQLIWFSAGPNMVARMDRHRALPVLLAAAIVVLAACSASSAQPASGSTSTGTAEPGSAAPAPDGTTRTSDGGQVTVVVDWAGPAAGAVFDVTLDTHSVDLDGLDLADAILRNDRGDALTAEPWAAPKGGHHREGALTFRGDAASFFGGAEWVELVLTGVGDLAERTLRWEVTS